MVLERGGGEGIHGGRERRGGERSRMCALTLVSGKVLDKLPATNYRVEFVGFQLRIRFSDICEKVLISASPAKRGYASETRGY